MFVIFWQTWEVKYKYFITVLKYRFFRFFSDNLISEHKYLYFLLPTLSKQAHLSNIKTDFSLNRQDSNTQER